MGKKATTEKGAWEWQNASGPIDYTMTNDYMFRMVLQNNEQVLRGLVSSVMHIPMKEIDTVVIENPINPGDDINDRTFILDIRIRLNNAQLINLEMQVSNLTNWQNRSLSYLCRTFDQLQKGEDYNCAIPVTHIGFLDYDLFPDSPEFFATYQMQNVKNHQVYNDNFTLCVLSLKQTKLATEEDKVWHIDEWARLFKAKTWEDIKMLAENNELYASAASSIYYQNADSLVREKCQAREEAIRHEEYVKRKMRELEEAREEAIRHEEYTKRKMQEMETELEEAREEAIRHEEYAKRKMQEMKTELEEKDAEARTREIAMQQEIESLKKQLAETQRNTAHES